MGKEIDFGSLNMDLTIECPRQPRMGETVTGSGFLLNPGGKGANQAVAASRLGADTLMIGAVGTDVFGDALVTSLERAGVACGRIRHIEGISTGVASITRVGGDNCIVLDPGANHVLTGHDVTVALDGVATPGDVFVTQLECDLAALFGKYSHTKELFGLLPLSGVDGGGLFREHLRVVYGVASRHEIFASGAGSAIAAGAFRAFAGAAVRRDIAFGHRAGSGRTKHSVV